MSRERTLKRKRRRRKRSSSLLGQALSLAFRGAICLQCCVGVLSELVPEEEVVEFASDTEREPIEARSFEFEQIKEGELPINIPIK